MHKLLLALTLAFPLAAQASVFIKMDTISCPVDMISTGESMLCGGDLTLPISSLRSELSGEIEAGGQLNMHDLNITPRAIVFTDAGVIFGAGVSIAVPDRSMDDNAQSGSGNSPWAGAVITVIGHVPAYLYLEVGDIDIRYPAVLLGSGPVWGDRVALLVPEPSTYAAMLAGLATLAWVGRRSRRKPA